MRIDLNCPYSEKDVVKNLGARWDPEKKVWFIVDVEELTPFMRWIKKSTSAKVAPTKTVMSDDRITLTDFLETYYAGSVSLTYKSARAFGIPYPLPSGWAKTFQHRTAHVSALTLGKKKGGGQRVKLQTAAPIKTIDHQSQVTGTKVFKPLCQCDALPWKDCEHTEALANAAMHEMLDTVL